MFGLPSLNNVIVSLGITILPSLLVLERKLCGGRHTPRIRMVTSKIWVGSSL
jgi:hypothetical protein